MCDSVMLTVPFFVVVIVIVMFATRAKESKLCSPPSMQLVPSSPSKMHDTHPCWLDGATVVGMNVGESFWRR